MRAADRIYCGHHLARIIGHPALHTNIEWRTRNLEALMEHYLIVPAGRKGESKGQDKDNLFFRGLDSKSKTLVDNVNIVNALMKHAKVGGWAGYCIHTMILMLIEL